MLALPLLLALAAAAEPPAAPDAPVAVEEEGPGVIVAPEEPPAEAPAGPAAPYLLDGFLHPARLVTGAVLRGGLSTAGLAGGVDVTLRLHGFVLGATVGGAQELGGSTGTTGLRTLGFLAGWGLQRGLYRGEALLGWGVTDERVKVSNGTSSQTGHFTGLQAALDRAVAGGEAWRATLGLMGWWRSVSATSATGLDTSDAEAGVAVRLGVEAGW
jgi:hypothetical protein